MVVIGALLLAALGNSHYIQQVTWFESNYFRSSQTVIKHL